VPSPEDNPELFEFDECHGHDHLIDFASYELVSASDDVTRGRKQGFFLVDLQRYCADGAPPTFPIFEGENIGLGISVGWADIYTSDLDCQWIDITSLPDGPYTLRFTVNPTGVITEDGPAPNTVTLPVTLRGDTITPR
ncbi:MAG TPA: lysyl oxidase family protein, partial [Kofleriaceae bacterium]